MRSWVLLACWALLAGAALGWNDLPHAKAAFLEHSGDDYGYGGKIDELHRRVRWAGRNLRVPPPLQGAPPLLPAGLRASSML